jgi:hypothetical protein
MIGHSTLIVRPSNGDASGEHAPDLVVLVLIVGGWGFSRAGTLLLLSEIVVGSKYLREESG